MSQGIKRVLLEKAVKSLGEKEVAARVGCPLIHIKAWLANAAEMPPGAFLKLVDLMEKTPAKPPEAKP